MTDYNANDFNLLKFRIWQLIEPEPFSFQEDYEIYPGIDAIVEALIKEGFFKKMVDKEEIKKYVKKIMKDMAKEGSLKVIPIFNTNTNLLCGRGYRANKQFNWKESEGK